MFSLRPYRSLKEEEETPYGKAVIFNCRGDIPARSSHSSNLLVCSVDQEEPSLISCSQTSSASSSIANRGVSVSPSSSYSTTITTSTSSSKSATSTSSSSPASFTLHSIKAAWKSLSSLSFSGSRLPHLERAESYPDQTNSHDYRYTHFPTSIVTSSSSAVPSASSVAKRNQNHKESPFSQTHLHISPASRSYGFPLRASSSHSSPSSTSALNLAHCLRRRRSKSKSDNALQKIGVGIKAHSDQNLHRVCLIGGAGSIPPSSNAIFSNVHLSGGSGDSGGSCSSGTNRYRGSVPQRSRSLERNHRTRIHSQEPPHHTRSLERNHKFRVNLRGSPFASSPARDDPPDHPAPPPPTPSLGYLRRPPLPSSSRIEVVDGSGGSVSSNSSGSSSSGGNSTMEGGQAGSFINKPPRGWLHPDQQLAQDGICYGVRYIGALEVNTSMKSLNFDTRSLIAKECISKVCEAAGLKTADRKRKVIKSISRILGDQPMMEHAGSNVTLTITSASLTLTTLECGTIVASHDMPNISFASGGDPDTLDFIAYVAKDTRFGRACFVLECGGGLAQDVITTIGQAFELRFKEYLKRTPASVQYTNVKPDSGMLLNGEEGMSWNNKNDLEYYNDLPGKVPPDLPPPVPPLPQYTGVKSAVTNAVPIKSPVSPTDPSGSAHSKKTESVISTSPLHVNSLSNLNNRGNDNLIDFTNEGTTNLVQKAEPEYVNDSVIKQRQIAKDPFDMPLVSAAREAKQPPVLETSQTQELKWDEPFSMQLTQLGGGGMASSKNIFGGGVPPPHVMKPLPLNQRLELQREVWFHGPISRREAEALLKQDGDFLVRESQGTAGQYVLTGIQNNIKKHLLLVDPEGVVRTKSRTFDSVSHLINYHKENELPIVSAESALVLRNPVMRPH